MMCKGLKRYLGQGGGNDVLWAGYRDDMQALEGERGCPTDNHHQLPFNHLMSFFIPPLEKSLLGPLHFKCPTLA